MKLRCDLHLNGSERRLLIVQGPSEPESHMTLRLAAYLLFWELEPIIDASAKTPALAGFDFLPDLLCLDESGAIKLWVECGSATMNKLDKLTKRVPRGRIIVLKENAREAERLRRECAEQLSRPERIEIWAWPGASFKDWSSAIGETAEVYGESSDGSLNVVVNERMFGFDFQRC